MADIRLVLNDAALAEMLLSPSGMVGREMYKRGRRVERAARIDVGVDTGLLRSSIDTDVRPGLLGPSAYVGSEVSYALMHHQGTRPHLIVPQRGQVLKFRNHGARVYASHVRHPGTRANPYLTQNLYRAVL